VLGRAVAVGQVLGSAAGLRETDRLRDVIGERHRWHAVRGHLHELGGDLPSAATAYAEAARRAEAALLRAEKLGGKRLIGPSEVQPGVEFGQFSDPDGHMVGLLKGRE
jgi:hypothetical protein